MLNRVFWALMALLPNSVWAAIQTPSGQSARQAWNMIWNGTFDTVANLIAAMVWVVMLTFMGWVISGLYLAYIVKGQIDTVDAGTLFVRLCLVVMVTLALVGS